MHVLSINVGRPRLVQHRGQTLSTAIYKQPVAGPVRLSTLGLEGDDQADKSAHGGVDKAVYVYTEENYAWWQAELGGIELPPGELGENLTVTGMPDDQVGVGDRFQIGSAVVQVTQPRTPCLKLGIKMGRSDFVKQFHRAARTGFYLRVLEAGSVEAGDALRPLEKTSDRMTVAEVYQRMFFEQGSPELYRQAAALEGLSEAWRKQFLEKA